MFGQKRFVIIGNSMLSKAYCISLLQDIYTIVHDSNCHKFKYSE